MHETYDYYLNCKQTERQANLFTADQVSNRCPKGPVQGRVAVGKAREGKEGALSKESGIGICACLDLSLSHLPVVP